MGVESVRQADIRNSLETPQSVESEEIQIRLVSTETPPQLNNIDGYRYDGQNIIKGEYQYESSPRFGGSETGEGEFQIRTGSGMVILRTADDRPRPKKIFRALDQVINSDTNIKRDFIPNQRQAWDFIERADEYLEIKVVTPNGQITSANHTNTAWEDMVGRYPIEIASLVFYWRGHEIQVRYHDDTLEIEPDEDDNREYIIQIFETVMS